MNIELARTFLEVVSCGSLARAAEQLNVTHSTVTMRIKALEEILRSKVLIRNRSGVTMTAAGRRFYPFAESLTRTWQLTRRQMSLASGFDGMMSVGAASSLWDDMMFEWTVKSRRENPEIAIRCESGQSEHLVERLFQGWLDFCLVYEARSRSGFTSELLFEDPIIICSTEDRAALPYWDPDYLEVTWEDGVKRQENQFWPDFAETPHLTAPTSELGLRFLMEFGGSILLPERVLKTRTFPRPLYPVPNQPVFEQKVYLIYSEDALKQRFPRMAMAHLRNSLLNQLAGKETLWDPALRSRQRKATA